MPWAAAIVGLVCIWVGYRLTFNNLKEANKNKENNNE